MSIVDWRKYTFNSWWEEMYIPIVYGRNTHINIMGGKESQKLQCFQLYILIYKQVKKKTFANNKYWFPNLNQ